MFVFNSCANWLGFSDNHIHKYYIAIIHYVYNLIPDTYHLHLVPAAFCPSTYMCVQYNIKITYIATWIYRTYMHHYVM